MVSETLRLFVAIELPPEVRQALARVQDDLRGRDLGKLRWVRPEAIHLTLKFLGETPAEKVPAIGDAMAGAVQGVPAHELHLTSTGTFGGRSPRVLWVGLVGDLDVALDLQQRIDGELAKIGFPREARAFSPHLTLARVRPETAREMAAPIAAAIREVRVVQAVIRVREISLMRSTLGPGGATYQRLASFPLGAAS